MVQRAVNAIEDCALAILLGDCVLVPARSSFHCSTLKAARSFDGFRDDAAELPIFGEQILSFFGWKPGTLDD